MPHDSDIFFFQICKFSHIITLSKRSASFFPSSYPEDSYIMNVITFDGVIDFPKSILILHNSFFSLLFSFIIFHYSVF